MASILKGKALDWRKRRGVDRESGLLKEQAVRMIKLDVEG